MNAALNTSVYNCIEVVLKMKSDALLRVPCVRACVPACLQLLQRDRERSLQPLPSAQMSL